MTTDSTRGNPILLLITELLSLPVMHFAGFYQLIVLAILSDSALAAPKDRCGPKETLIRKEWSVTIVSCLLKLTVRRQNLNKLEKKAYINAVRCLQQQPPQLASLYPGSKSRFDDFQVAHIDLTPLIHWNVRI